MHNFFLFLGRDDLDKPESGTSTRVPMLTKSAALCVAVIHLVLWDISSIALLPTLLVAGWRLAVAAPCLGLTGC
jgi:hypothetical protein